MTRRNLIAMAGAASVWGQSRIRTPVLGRAFDAKSGALVTIYGQPGSLMMAAEAARAPQGQRALAGAGGAYLLTVDEAGAPARWNADATHGTLPGVPVSPTSLVASERGGAAAFGYANEIVAVTMAGESRITLRVPFASGRVLAVHEGGRQAVVTTGAELWLLSETRQPVSLGTAQERTVAGFASENVILADSTVRRWSAGAGAAELAACREAVAVASPDGENVLVADEDGVLALGRGEATRHSSYLPPTQLLRLGGGCYLVTEFDSELVLAFAPERGVVTVIQMEVPA